ncbi:MAG: hypothetical protein OXC63_02470 [Aestuariivita sp.]|nr:hypothetical protein [Aestuariivita sp.]MCY4345503.1 hypothetical protein [Aestuariivita sp.]
MPVLSIIMKEAAVDGLRPEGSNPCRGIKRNGRQNRERFLSKTELAHLVAAFRRAESSAVVTILWLLTLTGCRSSEIRTLLWTDFETDICSYVTARPGHIWRGYLIQLESFLTNIQDHRHGFFLP